MFAFVLEKKVKRKQETNFLGVNLNEKLVFNNSNQSFKETNIKLVTIDVGRLGFYQWLLAFPVKLSIMHKE